MANICDTTYMIRGERQKVVALRDAIEKYETRGGTPLWQLAEHFGIDYEKRSICVRGEVYFYDFGRPSGR